MSRTNLNALQQKFATAREELSAALIERDDEIDMLMTALVAGENPLLIGPPGVAKSMLVDGLMAWTQARGFSVLFTKTLGPEDVFGPLDIDAFVKEKRWERVTRGWLPEAEIAFGDEALALDTPIPTPSGWTTVGMLRPGEQIFGRDGKPTKVIRLTPIVSDHRCFRVTFRDGESIVADAGHQWMTLVNNGHGRERVLTTEQLGNTSVVRLPRCAPLELPEADLPIDPYLLGLWLGNGNCWTGELYIRTEWVVPTVKALDQTGNRCSKISPENESGTLMTVSMAGTGFRTALADNGLIPDRSEYAGSGKHVPEIYLRGSITQRLQLLRGLMDTEGYINESMTCTFSNTNENLIDAVAELVRSLGGRCTKTAVKDDRIGANGPHQQCWKVMFHADSEMSPFLARPVIIKPAKHERTLRVVAVEAVAPVPVRCIEVEAADHLFLAGRSFAVTHNCFKASGVILNNLLKILNEGTFQNNAVWVKVPLLMFVGASNEWPSAENGQELSALLDRFLFRKTVKPVSTRAGEERLYDFDGVRSGPKFSARITPAEVLRARDDAKALPYTGAAKEAFVEIVRRLASEGIRPGDRRRYKAVGAARAYAYLCGASEVEPLHLECLQHVLWDDPREHPAKAAEVVLSIANPDGRTVSTLLDETEEIVRGYNRSDLTSYASADSKLQEILKKLKAVGSNPRAVKATGYVKEEIKRIRLATVAAGV